MNPLTLEIPAQLLDELASARCLYLSRGNAIESLEMTGQVALVIEANRNRNLQVRALWGGLKQVNRAVDPLCKDILVG